MILIVVSCSWVMVGVRLSRRGAYTGSNLRRAIAADNPARNPLRSASNRTGNTPGRR